MHMILAVGVGGALGAIARYLLVSRIGQMLGPAGVAGVPVGILAANVLGSFVMGVLVETMAQAWQPSPELRALLTVGLVGAFTTFSTFALEAVVLIERGDHIPAGIYVVGSVALSLLGLVLGLSIVRTVLG
jgi:CrcB protein